MQCHYSCSSCSNDIYFDLCINCYDITRTIIAGVCQCISGFVETQIPQCSPQYSNIYIQSTKIIYSFSLFFYFVCLMTFITRYPMSLVKKLIDTCQMIGLLTYLRYKFSYEQNYALSILDNFNFNFLNVYCIKDSPPLNCSSFQNLIAPVLTFVLFAVIYFIAYGIIYYKNTREISFRKYHDQNFDNTLLIYINFTAPLNTLTICRIISKSNWALFILFPLIIVLIYIIRRFYLIINHQDQVKLIYRSTYNYLFLYDQNYHLDYIDHLYVDKKFTPRSNYIIIQILYKIFWSASIIVCYQYKPIIIGFLLTFLLLIQFFMNRIFLKYENSRLIVSLLCDIMFLTTLGTYWQFFFKLQIFLIMCILQGCILIAYVGQIAFYFIQKKLQSKIFLQGQALKQQEKSEEQNMKKINETNEVLMGQ